MRIGILGLNHKLANLHLRELLAQACHRYFTMKGASYSQQTFVLLTTCNRTEIYFSSEDLAMTHSYLLQMLRDEINDDFDQKVYSYFGIDCFLHLSRVAAGLDSAIIAETEIQGQVKAAYEQAVACTHLPKEMHFTFQKALKIGKKVRSELSMGRGMPDLEHAVFNAGKEFFQDTLQAKVLFVGASDINCKILAFLKNKKIPSISICNRSKESAHAISTLYQIDMHPWESLEAWHEFDWIIFGTKAPHPLIKVLPDHCSRNKLIMDLCVPRNVDPQLGNDVRVKLLNIDQINQILHIRQDQMSHVIEEAEELVSNAIKQYASRYIVKTERAFELA